MAAGGVAAQKKLIGSSAVARDVEPGPGEGASHVLDMLGMPHLRRQAIISHHGDDAMPGEHPSHRRVDTEVILVAEHPGAAVDEENDRTFLRSLGRIDIELLPSLVGIRAVVIGDVRRDLDFVERRGGLVLMGAARGRFAFLRRFLFARGGPRSTAGGQSSQSQAGHEDDRTAFHRGSLDETVNRQTQVCGPTTIQSIPLLTDLSSSLRWFRSDRGDPASL